MVRRSRSSPIRAVKKSFTWSRRMVPNLPCRSPPAARPCAMRRIGRPTESGSPSATRMASFMCSRSPIARWWKWPTRRVARFVITPGRRAETSSRLRWSIRTSSRLCLFGVRMTVGSEMLLTTSSTRTILPGIRRATTFTSWAIESLRRSFQISNSTTQRIARLTSTRWRCAKTSRIRFRRRVMK